MNNPSHPPVRTHLILCNLRTGKLGAYEMFLAEFSQALLPDKLVVAVNSIDNHNIAEFLANKGIDIEFIPQWQKAGVPKPWGMIIQALRIIKNRKPVTVAIHFGNELPTIILRVLAAFAGCYPQWIWHQHQQVRDPNVISAKFSRLSLLSYFMDCFVAVYDGGRRSLNKRGIPNRKITVVHNGMVDHKVSQDCLESLRNEFHISQDMRIAVTVGWLVDRKRIDWLLDVWRIVVDRMKYDNLTLLILGDGPDRNILERLAEKYNISRNVIFLGERNDVRDIMGICDVYVHTSIAETCTYTITESMCAGIPAVVTDAGAAHEQILNDVSGFVTKPQDKNALVDRLVDIFSSSKLRHKMGDLARSRWQEYYQLNQTLKPLLKLYRTIETSCGKT